MHSQAAKKDKFKYILLSQVVAGSVTAFAVSPLNAIVDRSVIEYTSAKGELWKLARGHLGDAFKAPISFFTGFSFRWMYFVYFFTYSASNIADQLNITEKVPHPIQKLIIVFLTNTICSLIKDKKYAVEFGQTEAKLFPLSSYGLFFLRDMIAMASAFTIPPILGKVITSKIDVSPQNGQRIAQLVSPLLIQFITTPIHLLALDIYYRPGFSIAERFKYIKTIFTNALLIRMLRFLPAFGFGGIINTQLRKFLKNQVNKE